MNLRLSLRMEVKKLISSHPLLLQVSWLNVGQGDLHLKEKIFKYIYFVRLNATNALESTPLHTAACLPNFQKEIVELLLAEGSHMDMRNVQVRISFVCYAKKKI